MPVLEACVAHGASHEITNGIQAPQVFRLLPRGEEVDKLGEKIYFVNFINLDSAFSVTYLDRGAAEAVCALLERYLQGATLEEIREELEAYKPSIRRVKRKI